MSLLFDKNIVNEEKNEEKWNQKRSRINGLRTQRSILPQKQDNRRIIDGFKSNGEHVTLITENYDDPIKGVLDK